MNKIWRYIGIGISSLFFIQMLPSLIDGISKNWSNLLYPKTKVAVVSIEGEICNSNRTFRQLKTYFTDPNIRAILLYVDSPGGAAGASQALYADIKALKAEFPKPIITLTPNICASGGYYIACATDHIIAAPSTLIGSIGARIGTFGVKDLLDKVSVKYNVQKSGDYKLVGDPFINATPEGNQLLQSVSDDCYRQFIRDVADSRKLDLKQSTNWANGKIFTGEQAQKLGLVDTIGGNYSAIKKIKELIEVGADKEIEWVNAPKPSKLAQILGDDQSEQNLPVVLSELCEAFANKLALKNLTPQFKL